MTTALDIDLGPLAGQLIGEFGKTIQYNKRGASNYDPVTSQTLSNSVISFSVKAIVENYVRPLDGGSFDPATLISANDKKVTIAASSFSSPPILDDNITIDNTNFKVVNVKEHYISDDITMYELRVRH